MADKAISDLTEALQIFSGDWFVLQQGSEAKKLNGNTLKQYLAQIEINSIESVAFDAQGRCHIVLTDGTEIISQPLKGADGTDGTDGEDAPTITNIAIDANYHLIVTLSDGTSYDAGYCRGASGAGTGDMLAEDYDPNDAVATAGGIPAYITERYNPSAKTAEMTQEVGKDAQGKLWTNPAPSGSFLPLSGGTMAGAIAMGSNKITGLGAPTNNTDAATKQYVDQSGGVDTFTFVLFAPSPHDTDKPLMENITQNITKDVYLAEPIDLSKYNSCRVVFTVTGGIYNSSGGTLANVYAYSDAAWSDFLDMSISNPADGTRLNGWGNASQEELYFAGSIHGMVHSNQIGDKGGQKTNEQFGVFQAISSGVWGNNESLGQLLGTSYKINRIRFRTANISATKIGTLGQCFLRFEFGKGETFA